VGALQPDKQKRRVKYSEYRFNERTSPIAQTF
jgi:hypothetical protein